jgi:lysophospholipase L1-like esterase
MKIKLLLLLSLILIGYIAVAQQPQAPQNTPITGVNARYVQGVGIGYTPTRGASGVGLTIAGGTAYCNGSIQYYAGGTFTLSTGATSYVYLNTRNSCSVTVNTTGFYNNIPIAIAVTNSNTITNLTDARTFFRSTPSFGSTETANIIVVQGDSISAWNGWQNIVSGLDPPGRTYGSYSVPALLDTFVWHNFAVAGSNIDDMIASGYNLVDAVASDNNRLNIAIVFGGTNNLAEGHGVTDAYNKLVADCLARRRAGYKVIVVTMISRRPTDDNPPINMDALKNAYNALILAHWPEFADACAHAAGDAHIGADGAYANPYDEPYFTNTENDHGVHPTTAGYYAIANTIAPEINRISIGTRTQPRTHIKRPGSGSLDEVLRLSNNYAGWNAGPSITFNNEYGDLYPDWDLAKIGAIYAGDSNFGGEIVFFTNDGLGYPTETSLKAILTHTGKLGLGTPSPVANLDVQATSADVFIRAKSNTLGGAYFISDSMTSTYGGLVGNWNDNTYWVIGNYGDLIRSDGVAIYTYKNVEEGFINALTVRNNGFVGIGTNSPSKTLQVRTSNGVGNVRLGNDTVVYGDIGFDGANGTWIFNSNLAAAIPASYNYFDFQVDGSSKVVIKGNGNVGIGTAQPSLTHGSVNKLVTISGSDVALNLKATNTLGRDFALLSTYDSAGYFAIYDATAGSERIHINEIGNVGIGTTNPLSTVSVRGLSASGLSDANGSGLELNNAHGGIGTASMLKFSGWGSSELIQGGIGTVVTSTANSGLSDMVFGVKNHPWDSDIVEHIRLQAGGNLGIGTGTPGAKLDVYKPYTGAPIFRVMDDGGYGVYVSAQNTLDFNWGHNGDDVGYINYFGYNGAGTRYRSLEIDNGKGGAIAYFDGPTKYVGIGTGTPGAKLDVQGTDVDTAIRVKTNSSGGAYVIADAANSTYGGFIGSTNGTMNWVIGNFGDLIRSDGLAIYTNTGDNSFINALKILKDGKSYFTNAVSVGTMSTFGLASITSPSEGLIAYDTTNHHPVYYNSGWKSVQQDVSVLSNLGLLKVSSTTSGLSIDISKLPQASVANTQPNGLTSGDLWLDISPVKWTIRVAQ